MDQKQINHAAMQAAMAAAQQATGGQGIPTYQRSHIATLMPNGGVQYTAVNPGSISYSPQFSAGIGGSSDRKFLGKGKTKASKTPGQPRYWTPEEHRKFMEAASIYGEKDVKAIAAFVGSRTPTQVRTHAQKYAIRLKREQELREAGIDPKDAKKTGVKQALARAKEIMAKRKQHVRNDDEVVDVGGHPMRGTITSTTYPVGMSDAAHGNQLFPATTASKPIAVPRPRLTEGDLYTGSNIAGGRRRVEHGRSQGKDIGSPPFGSPFASAMKRVRVGSVSDRDAHYIQKHGHGHTFHDIDPFMISSVLGAASPSLSFLRAHGGLLSPGGEGSAVKDELVLGGSLAQMSACFTPNIAHISALEDRIEGALPGLYDSAQVQDSQLIASSPRSPLMSQLRDKNDNDDLITSFNTWVSPDIGGNTHSVLQEVCPEILSLDFGVDYSQAAVSHSHGAESTSVGGSIGGDASIIVV